LGRTDTPQKGKKSSGNNRWAVSQKRGGKTRPCPRARDWGGGEGSRELGIGGGPDVGWCTRNIQTRGEVLRQKKNSTNRIQKEKDSQPTRTGKFFTTLIRQQIKGALPPGMFRSVEKRGERRISKSDQRFSPLSWKKGS